MLMIISFIFFTLLVATLTYFKTKGDNLTTNDGYFLGGRSLTGGFIAGSLMLTNLSPVNFSGMSAQSYVYNMSVMGWEVCSGITLVLVAMFLVPRYLKGGLTTIPEFLEERFDSSVKQFVTYLFLVSYLLSALPPTLYAGALVLSQLFDIPGMLNVSHTASIWITVWAIGIIGAIYAIFGGLKAVAFSDTLNGIGLIIGGLAVPYLGFKFIGKGDFFHGVIKLVESHPEKFDAIGKSSDSLPFSTLFTGMILVNLYYWGTDQGIIQRALGAKNLKEGQKGVMIAGFLKILTPLMVIIPGIIGYHIYGDTISDADLTYSYLVRDLMPNYLLGFFAAVMFGAVLSSYNSVLNSAATLFSLNIYKPKFGKNKSDLEIVNKGKLFGFLVALISMFIAPMIMNAPNGLFQYLQTVNGFFSVPIFTIIFIGYTTKRVPAIAAKIALIIFVSSYAMLQLVVKPDLHFLHQLAILFVICCGIMLAIGKKYPRKEPFILKDKNVVELTPWDKQYEVATLIVTFMISFYLIFSKLGLVTQNYSNLKSYLMILWTVAIMIALFFRKRRLRKIELESIKIIQGEA
ncbi:solute:sodium symporter family transporter [Cetobacterium somerae]|uniref:solute:sodium symporter family transporter n=1 Tax=Cetobacterium TaxID=180162 RepID=UPI0021163171|nr:MULTISPECIES: solute:sodium symporter family transporter [Cetobacterium]MCQ8213700.1 solute:sodium symporter family transporter [Cetobacterium sp. NK01]WVJ03310.1 solute:sodium symporter family transporter [Cetobacterium somerae]